MQIKFKKLLSGAVTPIRATDGSNGFDLTAVDAEYVDKNHNFISYDTGVAFEIPKGYVGFVFPRSSVYKKQLSLANSVGVIDSDYRGTIKLVYNTHMLKTFIDGGSIYEVGDKVGQIVIVPAPEFELREVEDLSSTDRGAGGFGSTDKTKVEK